MADLKSTAASVYRDFETAGVTSSGEHEPVKAEIRSLWAQASDEIATATQVANSAAAGLRWTDPVRVRSTANVAIATALENGDTVNGVVLATGDRVFLSAQTDAKQNGIYLVPAAGAAARTTDADTSAELARIAFYVREGTTGAGDSWSLPLSADQIIVGTTNLGFVKISEAAGVAADVALLLDQVTDSGNVLQDLRIIVTPYDSTALPNERPGFSLVPGQIANNANIAGRFVSFAADGRKVRFTVSAETSADFTRFMYPTINVNTVGGGSVNRGTNPQLVQNGTSRIWTIDYEFEGDELLLSPVLLVSSATPAVTNEWIEVREIRWTTLDVETGPAGDPNLNKPGQYTHDDRIAKGLAAVGLGQLKSRYERVVIVKPSGGDFNHPKPALDSITDAGPLNRVKIEVYPGTYDGSTEPVAQAYADFHTKDYVDIVGVGRREDIVISYALPNNASAADISAKSCMWLDTCSRLENLTIKCRNMRYAIHQETSAGKPFNNAAIVNCVVVHEGNAAAVNNTWPVTSQLAVGAGLSDGEQIWVEGCLLIGPGGGYSYHTPNFTTGTRNGTVTILRNNVFVATDAQGFGLWVVPITIGGGDRCVLEGSTIVGGMRYELNQWVSPDTTTDRAQVAIEGHGNRGAAFLVGFNGAIAGSLSASLYRPFLADEEVRVWNNTGSNIPRGTVLAWADDARLRVRPMTSSDAVALYAGVAWEAIANGAFGRVKARGEVLLTIDVLRSGAGALAIGDTFSISGTPGTVQQGGSQGLLQVVRVTPSDYFVRVGL